MSNTQNTVSSLLVMALVTLLFIQNHRFNELEENIATMNITDYYHLSNSDGIELMKKIKQVDVLAGEIEAIKELNHATDLYLVGEKERTKAAIERVEYDIHLINEQRYHNN